MLTKREQAEIATAHREARTDILAQSFGGNLILGDETKIVHASTKANIMAKKPHNFQV